MCCPVGHGGDGFLKFQDAEEISSAELADAFEQMWQKRRFTQILYVLYFLCERVCECVNVYNMCTCVWGFDSMGGGYTVHIRFNAVI